MATIRLAASIFEMGHVTSRDRAGIEPIRGARLFQTTTHLDSRGELTALDQDSNLGFELQRVFFIRVNATNVVRAEHSCSAKQMIVVLAGAVTIDLDSGHEQHTLRLAQGGRALWLSSGVWLRLRNFSGDTLLLVAASTIFADTIYYNSPQPDLISAD